MLRTNFIPDRLARRRAAAALVRRGLAAFLLSAVVALLPCALLYGLATHDAARALALRQERDRLGPTPSEALWRREQIERLSKPRELVRAAHINNSDWLALLRELRDRLPPGAWLTEVTVVPSRTGPTGAAAPESRHRLLIRGAAESHEPIGQYLEALTRSRFFARVTLIATGDDVLAAPDVDPAEDAPESVPTPGPEGVPFELHAVLERPLRGVTEQLTTPLAPAPEANATAPSAGPPAGPPDMTPGGAPPIAPPPDAGLPESEPGLTPDTPPGPPPGPEATPPPGPEANPPAAETAPAPTAQPPTAGPPASPNPAPPNPAPRPSPAPSGGTGSVPTVPTGPPRSVTPPGLPPPTPPPPLLPPEERGV